MPALYYTETESVRQWIAEVLLLVTDRQHPAPIKKNACSCSIRKTLARIFSANHRLLGCLPRLATLSTLCTFARTARSIAMISALMTKMVHWWLIQKQLMMMIRQGTSTLPCEVNAGSGLKMTRRHDSVDPWCTKTTTLVRVWCGQRAKESALKSNISMRTWRNSSPIS